MINGNIQCYILKLQDIKDEIENDFLQIDFTRKESFEIREALNYIRVAINALYQTKKEED